MKKLFIIANWKSNTLDPVKWLEEISKNNFSDITHKEIIICPPFTLLEKSNWLISSKNLPFLLGSQDISKFDEGAYTGEINGKMLTGTVKYVIIGHSERRQKLGETNYDISTKVTLAKKYNLIPIVCVQNENTPIPPGVEIIAYEPIFAVGTGEPDTPQNANEIARQIKEKGNVKVVLYGGSINSENVHNFTSRDYIDGVLVGSKSLDPISFAEIIINS